MSGAKLVFPAVLAALFFLRPAIAFHSPEEGQARTDRSDYVGDASCVKCHRELSQKYEHTPHHLTSQLPTTSSVHGSFESGANSLVIVDSAQTTEPGLQFRMESNKDGFFEIARTGWGSHVYERAERIGLVTGFRSTRSNLPVLARRPAL